MPEGLETKSSPSVINCLSLFVRLAQTLQASQLVLVWTFLTIKLLGYPCVRFHLDILGHQSKGNKRQLNHYQYERQPLV